MDRHVRCVIITRETFSAYSENWFISGYERRFRWMKYWRHWHLVKFPDQRHIQDMKTNAYKLDASDLCSLICQYDAHVNKVV